MKASLQTIAAWSASVGLWLAKVVTLVSLWTADALIWVMLVTRSDERRIRPTKRLTWPKGLKRSLMRRQDNTCTYCGYRRIAASMEIDHIIPVVRGGSNDESNLQVICHSCNRRKGLQTDEEFRERYARLVPRTALTPPKRRISQREFREETRLTSQTESVQEFRKTRFISKHEKVVTGCLIIAAVIFFVTLTLLVFLGAEGYLLLLPSVILGALGGGSVYYRGYTTGAMIEEDEEE